MIFQPREFFWSQFWHFLTFFSGQPSWKIAIFSGSSFYMAERHFSHLVSHLPIGFKHIFHLLLTFVSFCPYRISTLFSHHSLKITLPLLTKSISHPPAHEFRETKKNLSKRQWVKGSFIVCISICVPETCSHWRFERVFLVSRNSCAGGWEMGFVRRGRVISREWCEKCIEIL